MTRPYALGVTTAMMALTVAACGSSSSDDELGEAFCADLEAGLTPAQIVAGAPADTFESTFDAAGRASLWVEEHCPAELATNEALRSFLDANGLDPDNLDG